MYIYRINLANVTERLACFFFDMANQTFGSIGGIIVDWKDPCKKRRGGIRGFNTLGPKMSKKFKYKWSYKVHALVIFCQNISAGRQPERTPKVTPRPSGRSGYRGENGKGDCARVCMYVTETPNIIVNSCIMMMAIGEIGLSRR